MDTRDKTEFRQTFMTITGAWEKTPGFMMSAELDDRSVTSLETAAKLAREGLEAGKKGGRIVTKIVAEEYRKTDTSPEQLIQYVTPEQVDEFKTFVASKGTPPPRKFSASTNKNQW